MRDGALSAESASPARRASILTTTRAHSVVATLADLPDDLIRSTLRGVTANNHVEARHRRTAAAVSLVAKRFQYVGQLAMVEGGVDIVLGQPVPLHPRAPPSTGEPPRRLRKLMRFLAANPDAAALITSLKIEHMSLEQADQWPTLFELLGLLDLARLYISSTGLPALGAFADGAASALQGLRELRLELNGGPGVESWDPAFRLVAAVAATLERCHVSAIKTTTGPNQPPYQSSGGFAVELPRLRRLGFGGHCGARWAQLARDAPRLEHLDVNVHEVTEGLLDALDDEAVLRVRRLDVTSMPMAPQQEALPLARFTNLVQLRLIDRIIGGKIKRIVHAPLPSLEHLILPATLLVARSNTSSPLFTAFLTQAVLNAQPPDEVNSVPAANLAEAILDPEMLPALRTVRITDMPQPDRDWVEDKEDGQQSTLNLLRSLQVAPRARYDREVLEIGQALAIIRPACLDRGVQLMEDA